MFCTVLNRYRSRKCDVGTAYAVLNGVLWQALDHCVDPYTGYLDVHAGKVIMMLAQTFYRLRSLTSDEDDDDNDIPPAARLLPLEPTQCSLTRSNIS